LEYAVDRPAEDFEVFLDRVQQGSNFREQRIDCAAHFIHHDRMPRLAALIYKKTFPKSFRILRYSSARESTIRGTRSNTANDCQRILSSLADDRY
jgi:hypothetical protein